MKRRTSIIILSYNTRQLLQECIQSIRQYTRPHTYEIIVVDNASHDGSVEWLGEQNDVHLIANDKNNGFPGGCNQGLRVAQGTELLLLNSDTLVTAHWLDNMLRALYSGKNIGAVGCMSNKCSNRQQIEVSYDKADDMQDFAQKFNRSDKRLWKPWGVLVGYCFLFKREVWEKVGELDEIFSPGNFEDDDYSLRIRLAGYELLLCKDTFIHHYGSTSFVQSMTLEERKLKAAKYNQVLAKNKIVFIEKWGIDSDSWNNVDKMTPHIAELADENSRLLLFDMRSTMDLYFLADKRPDLQLVGLSTNKVAVDAIATSFPVVYEENIYTAMDSVDDDFDGVVILEPLAEAVLEKNMFRACLQKISNRNGKLYLSDGKKVYALIYKDLLNS